MAARIWQKTVFEVLKHADVKQIAYVPDAGHAYTIKAATSDPGSAISFSPRRRRVSESRWEPGSADSGPQCLCRAVASATA